MNDMHSVPDAANPGQSETSGRGATVVDPRTIRCIESTDMRRHDADAGHGPSEPMLGHLCANVAEVQARLTAELREIHETLGFASVWGEVMPIFRTLARLTDQVLAIERFAFRLRDNKDS